jgi:Xaa-Pro aminopeptidase
MAGYCSDITRTFVVGQPPAELADLYEVLFVSGNATPLAAGHAFSVEPGIYLPGRCGARIEDIVVATDAGPERLNEAPRELAVVG